MGAGSSSATEFIQQKVDSKCVVIFSSTTCVFCRGAKRLFEEIGAPFEAIEVNHMTEGNEIMDVLHEKTGARTVPRVFVNGVCLGGMSETRTLHEEGKLLKLIKECDKQKQTPLASL